MKSTQVILPSVRLVRRSTRFSGTSSSLIFLVIIGVMSIPAAIASITWGNVPWPEWPCEPTICARRTWRTSPVTGILASARATTTTVELSVLPSQIVCSIAGYTVVGRPVASRNWGVWRPAGGGAAGVWVRGAARRGGGGGRRGRPCLPRAAEARAWAGLRPPPLPPERVPQIPLVVGIALCEAFRGMGADVAIKWPNDILHRGAKLAGILTEMRAEPGHVQAVAVGIGINIRHPAGGWPADIQQAVTDLGTATGKPVRRLDVVEQVIRSLDAGYALYLHEGFEPLRQRWWSAHAASDAWVRVRDGSGHIEGTAIAIDHDGALLLSVGGTTRRIVAGDLELMEGD